MMRISRRALLAGTGLAMAGCGSVPTSGPVQQVSAAPASQATRGVDIRPAPPIPGAAPDVLLAGFLDAMASLEPDHRGAREFLTPAAAQAWDPEARVTVFDGERRTSVVSGDVVSLHAPLTGQIDAHGHFQAAQPGAELQLSLRVQRIDGQWRIANPPAGLLVSQYTMQHRFSPVDVWFTTHSGGVVPERVWLAANPASPTQAVSALLAGPSAWLDPAVSSALPVGTTLASSVSVSGAVATVALGPQAATLPDAQRTVVLQQLAFTLAGFQDVQQLRVTVNAQPWVGNGQDASGAIELSALQTVSAFPSEPSGEVAAVRRGIAGRLDAGGNLHPFDGVLGKGSWAPGVSRVAVRDEVVAAVDRAGTQLVTLGPDQATPVVGLRGKGVGQPQVLPGDQVWVTTAEDGSRALRRGRAGSALGRLAVPALAGTRVVAYGVAPDLARLAVILTRGGRRELGLLRLHGNVVDGYRRLPLVLTGTELSPGTALGWANPQELMVLASTAPGGRWGCYLVSTDASQITPVGPAGDVTVRDLVVLPQQAGAAARVLQEGGMVLRMDGAWRWPVLASGVSALGPEG